jgi:hypothetical protein
MAFASMRPENMWEKNESLAKRAVKEFNKPGVRDHMEVVSQACQHTSASPSVLPRSHGAPRHSVRFASPRASTTQDNHAIISSRA